MFAQCYEYLQSPNLMPDAKWMDSKVREVLPLSEITVTDLTGGGDHFHLLVIDSSFEGMRTLHRQRVILSAFKGSIPNIVHALDIKALTPLESKTTEVDIFHPHGAGKGVHFKSIKKNEGNE